MGIAFQVFRLHSYRGLQGCVHHLLLRAGHPSWPNADAGAEAAADAFNDSAFDHLSGWWTRWWLAHRCPGEHRAELVGETTDTGLVHDDGLADDPDLLGCTGMRHADVWTASGGSPGTFVLAAARDEAAFWAAVAQDEEVLAWVRPAPPAQRLSVCLLTDIDGTADLRDL